MQCALLLCVCLGVVNGAKILGVFPHFGLTHWMSFKPIMEELAKRGHQVTVVSVFPRKDPMANYVDVSLEPSFPSAREGEVNMTEMEGISRRSFLELAHLYVMAGLSEKSFYQQNVLALANQTFDLVMMEFFNTDIYQALAYKIKAPVIGVSSCQITQWSARLLANPDEPSYVPNVLSFMKAPFSFWERVENLFSLHFSNLLYRTWFKTRAQSTAEALLGDLPDLEELGRNTTLILVNSHFTINNPRPLNPNVVEIGGINVLPEKSLPTPSYAEVTNEGVDLETALARSLMEMVDLYEIAGQAENTLNQKDVLALTNQTFDLVVMEFFHTDIYQALAHKIDAPVVGISSHQIFQWSSESLRNPDEPAHVPHLLSFLNAPFSFWERLGNTATLHLSQFLYKYFFVARAQKTADRTLGGIPPLDKLSRNTSLLLVNSHFTVSNPRPLNPNVIEIGGINVLSPKPLPTDLQELMDSAKDGVIYFSMGTVLKASTLSDAKRDAFLKTFARLKQVVLWKWDGQMKEKPANVHIAPWFPQRDLFAHKNMVLFISHCGNLGVNEAVHEGLPIICIPMFGDQPYNSKSVESQGMAEILDFYTGITYENVKATVSKVLNNPTYKRNARRVSKAYRDRPMTPLQTAIYWIEYVLRHEGAYHLRSAARNMPWYQYHNYDVYLLLHLILLAVVYSLYKFLCGLTRCFLGLCSNSRPNESEVKVKKS